MVAVIGDEAKRAQLVQKFVDDQNKKYPGRVADISYVPPFVSTGIPVLDRAIGTGGIPRGYMIEVSGDEGVGKSSLMAIMASSYQSLGDAVLWIDMEQRFWGAFALMLGINPDPSKFTLVRPSSGTEAVQIVVDAVEAGIYGLIVVDSVPALVPNAVMESDVGDANVASLSKLMADACARLGPGISKTNTTLVWINQIRSKPMVMMGKKEDTAGGRAIKFWSSLRLELDKAESIKIGQETVGHKIRARVIKNSWAAPFGKCYYDFRYKTGLDYIGSVIDAAIELGIIGKRSSIFDTPNPDNTVTSLSGMKATDEYIRTHPDVYKHIAQLVRVSENKLQSELDPQEVADVEPQDEGGMP